MSAAIASRPRASRIGRAGSARARARNRRIQAVIRQDTPGALPFFCECGLESCRSSVWLTLQEAAEAIERGELIIGDHFRRALAARLEPRDVP